MPENYFAKFPIISYANTLAVDITRRSTILNTVYSNPTLYYPYEIEEKERPDTISTRYYNDPYMDWILYLTNKVIDPYYDWYMDTDTFNAFLKSKYGTLEKATTKVAYYRNNWYTDVDTISVSAFAALSPVVTKYYEPLYTDNIKSITPYGYRRRQEDWTQTTNAIISFSANGVSFTTDELVSVKFDPTGQTGQGQVLSANTSKVVLQHVTNIDTSNTVTGSSYLFGRESKTNTQFTDVTTVVSNITPSEVIYWSPVTYFDVESELNERNRTIQVLNKQYSTQISSELKKLMKS